jgi:RNA polymerase sigma factor (TIGR02999 family)
MRRILVDHARTRHREKRGGPAENLPLDDALQIGSAEKSVDLVSLDEALQRLEVFDPRQARIVELRYFSGLTNDETAEILGVSNATVRNDWTMARAWLHSQLASR